MAVRREDVASILKDFHNSCSWVPATPAKPNSTKGQLICSTGQGNYPREVNWLESAANLITGANLSEAGREPEGFLQEEQYETPPTFSGSKNLIDASRGSNHQTADDLVHGSDDPRTNFSFQNLLALAHATGKQAVVENTFVNTDFVATNSRSTTCFSPQIEGEQSRSRICNSTSLDGENFLGPNFEAEMNLMNVISDGGSIPSRPLFDLNSPSESTDAYSIKGVLPQFQPLTTEQSGETALYRQDLAMQELRVNEVGGQVKGITKDGPMELNEKTGKSQLVVNQLCAATSTQLLENHKPDKGGTEEIDLSKTPQQKPRRKKHRPKVIIEGQHKGTKLSVEKTNAPHEAGVKRKYVRRKGVSDPLEGETDRTDINKNSSRKYVKRKAINKPEASIDGGTPGSADVPPPRFTRSSCRRSLNFDCEGQVEDESSSYGPSSNCRKQPQAKNFNGTVQSRGKEQQNEEIVVTMKKNNIGVSQECYHSLDQAWEDYKERSVQHFQGPSVSDVYLPWDNPLFTDQIVSTRGRCQILFSDVSHDKEATNVRTRRMHSNDPRLPEYLHSSVRSSTCLTPERQGRGLKRQNLETTVEADPCNLNESGALYNSLQKYLPILSQNADKNHGRWHFPAIHKKKRSNLGQTMGASRLEHTASTPTNRMMFSRHTPVGSCTNIFTSPNLATDGNQNAMHVCKELLVLGPAKKAKKRRSQCPTRLRNIASLLEICKDLPGSPARETTSRTKHKVEILHEPYTCFEALVADTCLAVTTKKRSKRSMLDTSSMQFHQQKSSTVSMAAGPPLALTWKPVSLIDSICEQLDQLDLNVKSDQILAQGNNALLAYHAHYQEQNALVPFQGSGPVARFDDSFNQFRRRRPRPKVDLDDETTRVWKLLLENINNEGVDGTDEEKARWWEEERRVFNGRADSFIARMHLVQGDRRFSPWKGSVVDSVVGVFLTQNVSDHLSSSAFMAMAARFPVESKIHPVVLNEGRIGPIVKEHDMCEMNSDGNFGLNKQIINLSVDGESDEMHAEIEDAVISKVNGAKSSTNNSDEFTAIGTLIDTSKHSSVVSETITNRSVSVTEEVKDTEDILSSQNSADSPTTQTTERSDSFLLSTSEEPLVLDEPKRLSSPTSFVKLLQMAGSVLQHGVYESSSNKVLSDRDRPEKSESLTIDMPNTHVDNSLRSGSQLPNLGGEEFYTSDTSLLTPESALQSIFQNVTTVNFQEAQKCSSPTTQSSYNVQSETNQTGQVPAESSVLESNFKIQEVNPFDPKNTEITGSSSNIDYSGVPENKEVDSNKNVSNYPGGKKSNGHKVAKGVRTRKEKEKQVDWDHLRKEARARGLETTKTANTMDSVDWEGVRRAGVNDVAETIKERGMNNMLAERIKDFLDRLVREHGSIDLEWLRDVPPDKAKEYLLSFRGLGLKSVECVRLLTLHHLAFPVDTNVGRIAVRLGWVPLQPLPESLQLHLLELYPVLESIQKYLWPRLCKLDQRTLYELHYQMITFGKVFCTKSKPNCNACPMRGECRHFASAFASARLTLPAPEDKSIMSAPKSQTAYQSSITRTNNLQLHAPDPNQMGYGSGVRNSEPIIEEPTSPEPIVEAPATPEPTCTQVSECDIENVLAEDPDEIPTIQLNMEEFTHNLQKIIQQNNELQDSDMSKAMVALTCAAASIPTPKLKNVNRLRTEHQVYELPDTHPLLEGMEKREPDDPCPYLLAIWTPGETVNSIEPPERQCSSQGSDQLCTDETCSSCNSIREANSQTVRGTILIPCRTAMRGSFPLNGTYFQVNEVFSDHDSSLAPIDVPREWLWNLPRRMVYFGTSIPSIFKGLSTEGIQYCFWRGFVCVRGFDRKTRAPRPLIARLHFPASRLSKGKGKVDQN